MTGAGFDRLFCIFAAIVLMSALMNLVLYSFLEDNTKEDIQHDFRDKFTKIYQSKEQKFLDKLNAKPHKLLDNLNSHASQFNLGNVPKGKKKDNNKKDDKNKDTTGEVNIDPDKERILKILRESGTEITQEVVDKIPTWSEVTALYGDKPRIVGLDQCERFRRDVPHDDAYIAPSGFFNTGTNLVADMMPFTCKIPGRPEPKRGFLKMPQMLNKGKPQPIRMKTGMLYQVPWGKHNPVSWRGTHTAQMGAAGVEQTHVLPVVIIKDPFHWMGSMCRHKYEANWYHVPEHCPNLVPDEHEFGMRGITRQTKSIPVHIRYPGLNKEYNSLIHLWDEWYTDYYNIEELPRLMIRFEDLLFHLEEVITSVCECAGGELINTKKGIHLQSEPAKKGGVHNNSNGLLSAIARYGSSKHRLDGMTKADIEFANSIASPKLMKEFAYNYPQIEKEAINNEDN